MLPVYASLIIFLITQTIITLNGSIIFLHLQNRTRNKLLILGSGIIIGYLTFLFFLGILSYILKDFFGIMCIFLLYTLFTFFIYKNPVKRINVMNFISFKRSSKNVIAFFVLIFYILCIGFYVNNAQVGADANIYWGIASSFARGNYPTVYPWQTNFLTGYHQGTFMIEGALSSLTAFNIESIHYIFTAVLIIAVFLFCTGLAREFENSFISITPAVLGIILFGVPILLTKNALLFYQTILSKSRESIIQLGNYLNNNPSFSFFHGGNGSGANDLNSLVYVNFYIFGLASFFVFLYFLLYQLKNRYSFKYFVGLVVLLSLTCSIDETFFFVEITLILFLFLLQTFQRSLKKAIIHGVILTTLLIILLTVIQNPIRDSLLTPSKIPRFKLLVVSSFPFMSKFTYPTNTIITWNGKSTGQNVVQTRESRISAIDQVIVPSGKLLWTVPDYRLLLLVLIITGFFYRSKFVLLLSMSSFLSFLFSLVLINTYWPPNAFRFTTHAFNFLSYGYGFLLVDIYSRRKYLINKIIIIVIIVVLFPQFIVSHTSLIYPQNNQHSNFFDQRNDPTLYTIAHRVPFPQHIIFLDEYPSKTISSFWNLNSVTHYGVADPISPPNVKVMDPDESMEWFDSVNNLAPYALKRLNVKYVFVQVGGLSRLSVQKHEDLNNSKFFNLTLSIPHVGKLYIVSDNYKKSDDKEVNLKTIVTKIGTRQNVYLDTFPLSEIRKIFILQLANRDNLIGPPYSNGGGFFMYIETEVHFTDLCIQTTCPALQTSQLKKTNFALLSPLHQPKSILPGQYNLIINTPYVNLWKRD